MSRHEVFTGPVQPVEFEALPSITAPPAGSTSVTDAIADHRHAVKELSALSPQEASLPESRFQKLQGKAGRKIEVAYRRLLTAPVADLEALGELTTYLAEMSGEMPVPTDGLILDPIEQAAALMSIARAVQALASAKRQAAEHDPAITAIEAFRTADAALQAKRSKLKKDGVPDQNAEAAEEPEWYARMETLGAAYHVRPTTSAGLLAQVNLFLAEDAAFLDGDDAHTGARAILRHTAEIAAALTCQAPHASPPAQDALAQMEDSLLIATDLNEAIRGLASRAGFAEGLDSDECHGLRRVAEFQGAQLKEAKRHWSEAYKLSA